MGEHIGPDESRRMARVARKDLRWRRPLPLRFPSLLLLVEQVRDFPDVDLGPAELVLRRSLLENDPSVDAKIGSKLRLGVEVAAFVGEPDIQSSPSTIERWSRR
jgi:hypothetical protein